MVHRRGEAQSRYVHRKVGGRGSMLIRCYRSTKEKLQISAAPLCSKLMPEVFKKSHKLLRSSKVLEERMLSDIGYKILG